MQRRNINKFARLLLLSLLTVFLSQVTSAIPRTGVHSAVLVGAGDISTCENNNDEATAKLLDNIPGTVLALGDNVYIDGTYSDFINCYHPTWGRHKDRTRPVPGNHEYFTPEAAGYFQYFSNVPSYYAYDLGDWRIYALNSEIDVSATSAQVRWVINDLAAHPSLCVLAYWHKPYWSSRYDDGSDATYETLWKTFHNAGAELIINGHVHNYERFKEMDAVGTAASPGLREIIVGTGGVNHDGYVIRLSTSEVRDASTYGVLKLMLRPTDYSWQFVPVAGQSFKDSGATNCHR
jgi:acid phosphatase type 7